MQVQKKKKGSKIVDRTKKESLGGRSVGITNDMEEGTTEQKIEKHFCT